MFTKLRSSSEKVRRIIGTFILMLGFVVAASAILVGHGYAAADSVKIEITTSILVDNAHPARTVDVDVAAGNYSNLQIRDITVAEAETIVGPATGP